MTVAKKEALSEKEVYEIVEDAVNNFNYPNEMGEYAHESIEALDEILKDFPQGYPDYMRIVQKLYDELSKEYLSELDESDPRYDSCPYTEAKLSKKDGGVVLDLYNFGIEKWEQFTSKDLK